jgi:periplasmic divalent cation tolerance protein
MTDSPQYILVLTTSPGSITAKKLANELVETNAAACVNILPKVHSVFRWKNSIEHEDEYLLLIKTVATNYKAVEDVIKAYHPYELPEIISLPVDGGLPQYLAWLDQSTTQTRR